MNKYKIVILSILLSLSCLNAEINDRDKILVLTDYLVEKEGRDIVEARNEAIATIYGEPQFEDLVYDDESEMFFARVVSQKGNFSKEVNFYMPRQRAINFKENLNDGLIKIEHAFDNNEIVIREVELSYKGVEYPLSVYDPSTITLKVGAYFVTSQNTEILAKKNGVGAAVNLQDMLGMKTDTEVLRVNALYKFNARHKVEFSYYNLENSAHKETQKAFDYNGQTIAAGASLDSTFQTEIYKLNYIYSAYQTNKLNLSFRAGLHITGISTSIKGEFGLDQDTETIQDSSVSVTAPLPVAGLGLEYKISNEFSLNYTIDYFFVSYEDVTGSMTDTLLSLDYKYNHYIGLGVGFNSTKTRVEAQSGKSSFNVRHEVYGALAYLIFNY